MVSYTGALQRAYAPTRVDPARCLVVRLLGIAARGAAWVYTNNCQKTQALSPRCLFAPLFSRSYDGLQYGDITIFGAFIE